MNPSQRAEELARKEYRIAKFKHHYEVGDLMCRDLEVAEDAAEKYREGYASALKLCLPLLERLGELAGHASDCAWHKVDRECQTCGDRLVWRNGGYHHKYAMMERHGAHSGDTFEDAARPDCTCDYSAALSELNELMGKK